MDRRFIRKVLYLKLLSKYIRNTDNLIFFPRTFSINYACKLPHMKRPAWLPAPLLLLLSGMLMLSSLKKAAAQSLSFTPPQMLLPDAGTDKAIDITNFKGGFFVTWKETGSP